MVSKRDQRGPRAVRHRAAPVGARCRAVLLAWTYVWVLAVPGVLLAGAPAAAQTPTQEITDCGSEFGTAPGDSVTNPAPGTVAYAVHSGGTWTFACDGTIAVTSTLDVVNDGSVTLEDTGRAVILSGQHSVQLFSVAAGGALTLDGLTLENGRAGDGAPGVSGGPGGAIYNSGTLTVSNSTFDGNSAGNAGTGETGASGGPGGAIYNSGTLTVSDSTFSGNSAGNAGTGPDGSNGGTGGDGGAIDNASSGTLSVANSTFSGNAGGTGGTGGAQSSTTRVTGNGGFGGYGGAIFNGGDLTVSHSTFSGNAGGTGGTGGTSSSGGATAVLGFGGFGGFGGAIENANSGTLRIANSTFSANEGGTGGTGAILAVPGGFGGAIDNEGTLSIADSTFGDNAGGAVSTGPGLVSTLFGVSIGGSKGGAIYNGVLATLSIADSIFSGNVASNLSTSAGGSILPFSVDVGGGSGGAIFNGGGSVTVSNSTFSGNSGSSGYEGSDGGDGGAIYNSASSMLSIASSTFSANAAGNGGNSNFSVSTAHPTGPGTGGNGGGGGAVYNDGTLSIANSTFSGNTAGNGGNDNLTNNGSAAGNGGDGGSGGAIDNILDATLSIANSTFSGNAAGRGGTGNLSDGVGGSGGAIDNDGGTAAVSNAILASSPTGANCAGTVSAVDSVEYGDTSCGAPSAGHWLSGNPDLGPLAPNGGPTDTMALGGTPANNPALGGGDPAVCAAAPVDGFDQRGYPRSAQPGHCDIGAYQATPPPATNPETPFYGFVSTPLATAGALAEGQSVSATVYADTSAGQPAPYAPVYLSLSGTASAVAAGVELTATPQVFSMDANGQLQVSFTAGPPVLGGGTDTLTASGVTGGGLAPAADTYTYPAPAADLAFATPPLSGLASSLATLGPLQVELQQTGGGSVAAPPGGVTVTLHSSDGTGGFSTLSGGRVSLTLPVTIPAGASVSGSVYFGDAASGTPTVTAAAGGLGSVAQAETVTPGAATTIRLFGASSPDVTIRGTDTVSGAVYDSQGDPVAGATVDLAVAWSTTSAMALPPAGSIPPSVTTGADGGFSTLYDAPPTAGQVTLTARSGTATASTAVQVSAGPAAAISLALDPSTVATGQPTYLTVQVSDRNGNPVSQAAVQLTADGTVFSTVYTNVYGVFGPAAYTAPVPAGPVLLTASSPVVPGAPAGAVLEVTPASGSPGAPVSGFTGGDGGLVLTSGAGSAPQVTVTATGGPGSVSLLRYGSDPEGEPGPDGAQVYLDAGVSAGSGFGEVTIQICGLTGSPVAYGWNGGAWTAFSPQGEVGQGCLVIGPLPESALSGTPIAVASLLTAGDALGWSPQPLAAAGSLKAGQAVSAVVYAEDAGGNPIPGATVYLSFEAAAGGGGTVSVGRTMLGATPQAFTTDGGGQVLVTYTAPATLPASGTDTLTAAIAATNATVSATDSYSFAAPFTGFGGGGGGSFSLAPTVSGISPAFGAPAGGTAVTVTGARFSGATAVSFGGTPASSFTVDSDSRITATAPAGTGTVDVTVTTPYGASSTGYADQFTYSVAAGQAAPAAAGTAPTFSDVPSSYWAHAQIEALAARGIISGFPDGTFRPDQPVTRAQFVKMLDLTLGKVIAPGSAGATTFSDVPPSAWYAPYVLAAFDAGIVEGTSTTTFSPDAPVTREQMAVLLARALRLTGTATTLHFSDDARIAPWALAGVEAAVAAGYIDGFPDGTFQPQGTATRAQAAKVLAAALSRGR